jgi:hypothetical protein
MTLFSAQRKTTTDTKPLQINKLSPIRRNNKFSSLLAYDSCCENNTFHHLKKNEGKGREGKFIECTVR